MKKQTGNRKSVSGVGGRVSRGKTLFAAFLLAAGMMAGTAFGADWPHLLASGGNQSYVTNVGAKAYGVHIFTNTSGGTFTPNPGVTNQVQYMIVGGGGGGGNGGPGVQGGGGGGGGVVTNGPSFLLLVTNALTITIGDGGAGGASGGYNKGTTGKVSRISSSSTNIFAYGGGGGAGYNTAFDPPGAVGSAGGRDSWAAGAGGTTTTGQGNNGGAGAGSSSSQSGGGGGAGSVGASSANGGQGGNGCTNSITGAPVVYAGGGKGTGGTGGSGLDGRGFGGDGTGNTGGGKGGSGVVVLRYEIPHPAGIPDIENIPPTNVTTTSATLNGHLITKGDSSATVCVLWGETNGGNSWTSWANTNWWNPGDWADGESKGVAIGPLTPNKTYYYTFAATNTTGSYIAAWPASPPLYFITGDVTVKVTSATAQYPSTQGEFQIMRPNTGTCTNLPLTIYYTMSGSASNGTDYINTNQGSALPGSVTLAAGVTSATITVTAIADFDGIETAVLTLSPSNYPSGSPSYSGTVTINPAPALGSLLAWGGDVSYATNVNGKKYGVHIYTNTVVTDFTPSKTLYCEYLIVGGGGGGGCGQSNTGGGGGGAGGLVTNRPAALLAVTNALSITVGSGGAGILADKSKGSKGGNSSISSSSTNITANGGGGGQGQSSNGHDSNVGSGGGGGYNGSGGIGTAGQGKDGGAGYSGGTYGGGGGGGAGTNGAAAPSSAGGNGGYGLTNSITGAPVVYAGGGGGADGSAGTRSSGGSGGGGYGGDPAQPGTDGLGGGGGGCRNQNLGSAKGGSGIVVIRYELLSASVTAPATNQSFLFGASITATGTVSGVTNFTAPFTVTFYTNTASGDYGVAGSASAAPYTVALAGFGADTTNHIYAVVTDSGSPVTTNTSSTNTFYVLSPQPPAISLSAPTNNQSFFVGSTVAVTATVSGVTGPYTVTFYTNSGAGDYGAVGASQSGAGPFSTNLTGLATNTYGVYARVTDSLSLTNTSATNSFIVRNLPVSLSLTAPTNNQLFIPHASISATATVVNGTGPFTVKFYTKTESGAYTLAGTVPGPGPSFPLTLGALSGRYQIYATVTDALDSATSGTNAFTAMGPVPAGMLASGGDTAYVTNLTGRKYGIHIYTNSLGGAFWSTAPLKVEYLVVGGGGGGGNSYNAGSGGGGGGAGGLVTNAATSLLTLGPGTTVITVGGGGATDTNKGSKGGDSSISSINTNIVAYGGGGGLRFNADGYDSSATVGSGGGGALDSPSGGTTTSGQGQNGGRGEFAADYYGSGGGGGAGTPGSAGTGAVGGGKGGDGVTNSITGTPTAYAGGGGGGGASGGSAGTGGAGGGAGAGANNGTEGLGGGGGGGYGGSAGGRGGSGIVVIRYEIVPKGTLFLVL